jgi:hypothetical protein
MSMPTASRDLAAVKHALELGLILVALIIATIMIVAAVRDDVRKPTPDITIGQVMFTPAQAIRRSGAPSSTTLYVSGKRRAKEDMNPLTGKVQRRGTFDGYEVVGWRRSGPSKLEGDSVACRMPA